MKEIDELTSPLINPLIENDRSTIKKNQINENVSINNSEDNKNFDNLNNEKENLSNSEIFSGTIKILYHIKDYLFTLLLLILPCPNFSYLSIPYYFFGIISIFFLLKTSIESRNRKYILEIIILVYSILSLIFKVICLIAENLFNDDLIIQIGIAIKKNKDDIFYVFTTFVPDSTIFIISILSIIITKISKNYTKIIDKSMNKNIFNNIFSIFLWLNFIFISAFSCFNISYLTFIYIILINIPILLWCFNFKTSRNKKLFNFISIISLIIMILSNLVLVHFNIYKFYPEKNNKLFSLMQILGIENLNLELKVENMFLWTGYILSNICIVLLITTKKLINTKIKNEKIKKIIIDENISINSKQIEESTIKKIIQYLKNYLSSPSFVLHFTRFGIITWIYFYRNYPSFFLLIWLSITFLFIKTSKNLFITKYIAFPSLYYTILIMHYSNIQNVYIVPSDPKEKIKKEHFGFIKFEYDQRIEYSCLFLVLLLTYLFTYSLVRHIEEKKIIKKYKDKNLNDNMNENLIENKNKSDFISMKNILLKFILANIDKLTLASMYFVANQFVNFSHVLLVILFNFQLLAPKKFEKTCLFIMILVELVFISEYILDLLKVFFDFRKELIRLFLAYSHNIEKTSIEILLFLAIYCLYIQYQFINSKAYQNVTKQEKKENKNVNNNIINNNEEEKKKSNSIFKKIFYILRDIIIELYIWIIIVLCFILLCAFEINLLFLIKLFIYLFILYDFLTSIQEKKNLNKLANWIFLLYCAINTLIVYFYQFSQLEICKDFFENIYKTLLPNFIYKNFTYIGLVYYSDNLPLKFLPHFGLNFLSILFLRETNRITIYNEQYNNSKKKNKVNENVKIIDENEEKKLIKNEENQKKFEKEQRNIKIVKKEIIQNQIKYYIFQIIIFITKFYFLFLFLTVCLILTNYDISFAITIYISIFGISFLCLFRKNIKSLKSFISKKSFFLSKLIRYSQIELPSHIQANKYYRSLILKILLLFSELYILLLYSYGTFYMIQHHCNCEGHNCDKNIRELISKEKEDFISSISYLIGFYINISNSSILNTIKFHLFLSVLISFDVYIQRLQNYSIDISIEIKKIIKNLKREKREINYEMKLKNKNILSQINTEIQNQNDKLYEEFDDDESIFSDQKSLNSSIALKDKKDMNDKEKGFEILKEKFKKIFTRAAQSKLKLKSTNNSYIIIKALKNIFEELIILLLLCTSLSKANIFSYIYMIISIIFVFKKKTMYQYFILINFLVCTIIIQSIFFVSNLTEKTDPQYDKEMISLIEKVLYCPWFKRIFKEFNLPNYYFWGYFFGIGVDKNQINSIWFEFILVVFIYIYLDLFSFSIYQDVINTGQRSDGIDKINYYYLSKKKKIVDCIKGMDNNDFSEYKNCMEKTFDIKIGNDFGNFKKKFFISEDDDKENENIELNNKNNDIIDNEESILDNKSDNNINKKEEKKEEIKNEEKKENEYKEIPEKDNDEINTSLKMDNEKKENKNLLKNIFTKIKSKTKAKENNINFFKKIKSFLYLSFHNFTIVIVILISMMVSGLISATYFIFSLFFLMESSNLILGTYFSYPKQIRKNIRIIILIDIFLQLFLQNPIFIKLREITIISQIEKIIGISEIIIYGSEIISINKNQLLLIVSKIITLFFINLQVLMFSSQDFQEFYLTYLITKNDRIKRTQMMNVFIFNNKRVKKMNENIERRITMDKAMNSLEKTLEEWNQKLIHINDEKPINLLDTKKNDQSDNISVMTGGSNLLEENIVKEEIKNYILSGFLVRILLFLHKYSSCYNIIEGDRKIYYERDMIQGKTFTKLYLEELIDKELNRIDMKCYKKKDIKIVKMILNGERKMKDEIKNDENIEEEKEVNLDNIINKYNDDEEDFNKKNKDNKNEKNKNKIKIDFTLDKFKKIDELREGEIYQKYLKKITLIIAILKYLIHYFSINFHYLSYLMMIINHMISGSFLTLIYPISVFCYAFPQNLRPKKQFWNFCLSTSIIIIIIKFTIQLSIIQLIIPKKIKDNLEYYKSGIEIFESTFSREFFNYIICDALVIIFISIQIYILINQGLWKEREQDIENIYEANERILLTKDVILKNDEDIIKLNRKFIYRKNYKFNLKSSKGLFKDNNNYENEKLIEEIEEEEIEKESEKNSKKEINKSEENKSQKNENKNKKNEENKSKISYFLNNEFFKNLFPFVRNEKPGNDYYVFYTSIFMIILLYLIVFYTSMEQDKTFGAVTANQNQFSGIMVIFLVFHVLFLIWDRIIYIKQNRNNLKYKYAIYNKENSKPISQNEYDKIKKDIINKYIEQTELQNNFKIPLNYIETLNNKYKIVFIQHEEFNYPLFGKYIHHILITIFSHILIFFFLPFKGNYNIVGTYYCSKKNDQNENCNNFLDNKYIIFFYILYIFYLSFSSLQIQKGLLDMKKKSILKSGDTSINSGIYNGYKNTPFLYEIKLAIDWTFTTTSLDFFQWAKFESVYDTIYITMCNMKYFKTKPVGLKIKLIQKITLGATIWISLILLLILPLLIFSNLNPINELNNVTGAKTSLKISFIKDNVYSNYTLFENSHVEGIEGMFNENDTEKPQWNIFNYSLSYMKNFPHNQIQIIYMSDTSDHVWDIAIPHIEKIKQNLYDLNISNSDKIQLYYEYSFQRPKPAENKDSIKHIDYTIYDKKKNMSQIKIINDLYNAINDCKDTEIDLENFYYAPMRLSSSSHPKLIDLGKNNKYINIKLSFHNCKIVKNDNLTLKSYTESYFQIKKNESYNNHIGIEFHTFNDQVSTVTSSYSVLTFYLSFVLIAGSYVRSFLQGQPEKIILTEMPESEQLVNLCEGIKTARFSFDLEKEEHLYYVLIELMRSPDYLKLLTKSSLQQFKDRKENFKVKKEE